MSITLRGRFWHYEFMLHGVKYRGSTKQTVKAKAVRFEAMKMAEAAKAGSRPRLKKAPILSEFATDFLAYIDGRTAAGSMDPDTKKHYHHGWKMLASTDVAAMRIDQISSKDASILKFQGGAWNARAAQKTLSRMLHYAAEIGMIAAAPRIKKAKAYGRSAVIDSATEAELLKHLSGDGADIFAIIMDSGMRPEEVMRMRWSDILWDRSVIFIRHGKTQAARRYVPMSNRVRDRLRVREQGAQSEWVFPGRVIPGKPSPGHRVTIHKQFDRARKAAGISREIVLYSCRHSFGTNLLGDSGNIALVQQVMGHESIATTQKYLHPSTSQAAEIVNRRNRNKGLTLVKGA